VTQFQTYVKKKKRERERKERKRKGKKKERKKRPKKDKNIKVMILTCQIFPYKNKILGFSFDTTTQKFHLQSTRLTP